jgi:Calcineurin-like phosphoesterase
VKARPSYVDEGRPFELGLSEPEVLEDDRLPTKFHAMTETRKLISTALRTRVLRGYTFWCVRALPREQIGDGYPRKVSGEPRGTLYDLVLYRQETRVAQVHHALFLRPCNPEVRFVHLTDLHIASRNDLWDTEIQAIIDDDPASEGKGFVNFNEHLRQFIRWANKAADAGELDFVWALGDLVDFVHLGLVAREPRDNNWSTLIDMLISCPHERERGNRGLRVPLFTAPGNHDWRTYPYPPDLTADIFGISKASANELDYL